MHTFLLLVAIHALILGSACLIAGWCTLIGADAQEIAETKQRFERARQQGWFATWQCYAQYRHDFGSVSRIASHWMRRPDARKFIYVGAAFLAFAAVVGFPLGVYR
jgi:hypothetical protein